MERQFGHLESVAVGTAFSSRAELAASGIHRPLEAGISGSQYEGADSVVVSGGYEDDEDYGKVIIYTGHGGKDKSTGKQIADQKFERNNKALAKNKVLGLPVRAVRGPDPKSSHAPPAVIVTTDDTVSRTSGMRRAAPDSLSGGTGSSEKMKLLWRPKRESLKAAPKAPSAKPCPH